MPMSLLDSAGLSFIHSKHLPVSFQQNNWELSLWGFQQNNWELSLWGQTLRTCPGSAICCLVWCWRSYGSQMGIMIEHAS